MNFDRPWTAFALEAECEHFGFARIAKAHNAEIAALRARAERAEEDAARWRHAVQHGFPVHGETPEAAIDAARAA